MRVCLITGQFASPLSGVGTYARALATGLSRAGIGVTVACPPGQSAATPGIDFLPIRVRRLPGHARWIGHARAFARCLVSARDFDLVHFMDAREARWARPVACPVVGTVHDYYFANPRHYWHHRAHYPDWPLRIAYATVTRALESAAYKNSDALIANSEATRTRILDAYKPLADMTTVHIGLDLARPPEDGACRKNSILFVGGNPYRKGLDRLVRCLPDLTFTDAQLWVAGTRVPRRLLTLASRRGVGHRIRCFGSVYGESLQSLYRQAKVVALPGVTEAFGLVFMEAMAARCAVVGPTDGGAGELIRDGETGYLVPGDDDTLLLMRLNALLNNDDLRRDMADRGLQAVTERSVHRMVSETLPVYTAAIQAHASRRGEDP